MRIAKAYKLHSVADQNIIILQGKHGVDTTKVLQLNATSVWLWGSFVDVDSFTLEQVVSSLEQQYGISSELAQRDAQAWIYSLAEYNIIVCD